MVCIQCEETSIWDQKEADTYTEADADSEQILPD